MKNNKKRLGRNLPSLFLFIGILAANTGRGNAINIAAKGIYRVPRFEGELCQSGYKALADAAIRVSAQLTEKGGELLLSADLLPHRFCTTSEPVRIYRKFAAYIGDKPRTWAADSSVYLRGVCRGYTYTSRKVGFVTTALTVNDNRNALF